jgi:hypothetical protein
VSNLAGVARSTVHRVVAHVPGRGGWCGAYAGLSELMASIDHWAVEDEAREVITYDDLAVVRFKMRRWKKRRRIAGLVMPSMSSRRTLRWCLASPLPISVPPRHGQACTR